MEILGIGGILSNAMERGIKPEDLHVIDGILDRTTLMIRAIAIQTIRDAHKKAEEVRIAESRTEPEPVEPDPELIVPNSSEADPCEHEFSHPVPDPAPASLESDLKDDWTVSEDDLAQAER